MPLFLGVTVNGHDTKLVAAFALHDDQRLSIERAELEQLGLLLPPGTGTVYLDTLAGVSFIYDEQHQVLAITAANSALAAQEISGQKQDMLMAPASGVGSVLNYNLYASTPDTLLHDKFDISGISLSLDGRIYSPFGVLSTTGIARSQGFDTRDANTVRYESQWSYADQNRMLTYSIGDVVSGSLPWSRSVRLGGAQIRRDFDLRGDVIRRPLLSASGSAAVPSTVDVYIGNVKAYTTQVAQGPFNLTDIPMINSHGDATIVLRDPSGRESTQTLPFYASQNLLRKGMADFSLEAGLPRQAFGSESFAYATDNPAASASARYGISDNLTLQAHAEGNLDVVMGGAGATTVLFNRAEVTAAGGASAHAGNTGVFGYGSFRTDLLGINVGLSSLRTFGDFADLAYVTGLNDLGADTIAKDFVYLEPPKALDTMSLGIPLYFDRSSVGVNFIHAKRTSQEDYIVSASYSRGLGWNNATLGANAFADFSDASGSDGYGAYLTLSMPVWGMGYASTSLARDSDGAFVPGVGLSKPMNSAIGSTAYRLQAAGTGNDSRANASASYRSRFGLAQAGIRTQSDQVSGNASLDGSLVMAGGGVFAGNSIYDSFAIVDAGVPDVPVLLQNRAVATTGRNGKALVTGLRAYSKNKLSVDVSSLPIDATLGATDETVVPARRSGVVVNFNGGRKASGLIVLRDAQGKLVQAGSRVKLNASDTDYFAGYDGEVWFEDGLEPENILTVTMNDASCQARFTYKPNPGHQVVIDPVECK